MGRRAGSTPLRASADAARAGARLRRDACGLIATNPPCSLLHNGRNVLASLPWPAKSQYHPPTRCLTCQPGVSPPAGAFSMPPPRLPSPPPSPIPLRSCSLLFLIRRVTSLCPVCVSLVLCGVRFVPRSVRVLLPRRVGLYRVLYDVVHLWHRCRHAEGAPGEQAEAQVRAEGTEGSTFASRVVVVRPRRRESVKPCGKPAAWR